jgi:hypothetical protein
MVAAAFHGAGEPRREGLVVVYDQQAAVGEGGERIGFVDHGGIDRCRGPGLRQHPALLSGFRKGITQSVLGLILI